MNKRDLGSFAAPDAVVGISNPTRVLSWRPIAMPILLSLHGRARMRRAGRVRNLLLCFLLLVPLGLRALEVDVFRLVRFAANRTSPGALLYEIVGIVLIAGYACAGAAFDRLGLKRIFALVLLAWSALVAIGALLIDPAVYRTLSPLLTTLLPCFVVTGVLVAARLSWPLRRRGLIVAALLIAYEVAVGSRLSIGDLSAG